MPLYDVFLSHANADKPAVEHLARKLREVREEAIEPFLDKWHLVPGEPWQEALEEALDQSRTCAVFVGKAWGSWQHEEMRSALETRVRDAGFRVIPVLLPGGREPGKEELPRFLRRLAWVDFRAGLDDEDAFRRLVAGIRGKAPGPGSGGGGGPHSLLDRRGYRCMAPAREPFVQRSEYEKVRDALLAGDTGRGTTVGITTAIHGAGGFGKTALAIELCYDEQVREKYPDGILWTTMGEEIDTAGRLARVRDLIRWWMEKEPPAFETISAASAHLREELNGKRVLLVVDDVWRPEDIAPFQGLALLCTTRDSRTLPTESVQVHVDALEMPEAIRLLGTGLPAGAETELGRLAARLGEWPLLLRLVNRQVASWISRRLGLPEAIQRAEDALTSKGLTYFDPKDAKSRSEASALTLEVSLERLSPETRERYTELAIFPEDVDVPLSVLEKLWKLDSLDAEDLAARFFDLSLLRSFDLHSGTIRLHDVIRAYLLERGESHLPKWHQRLLDGFRPVDGRWSELPPEENYLWNYLLHHLSGAGQREVCRSLLLDFDFLEAKLKATDVNALLADYVSFGNEEEMRLVQGALRLSALILAKWPDQLREQLWGRLRDRGDVGIQSLLHRASEKSSAPWLQPRFASCIKPGSALIRVIEHSEIPEFLTALDEHRVISLSEVGTLRIVDAESGRTIRILIGPSTSSNSIRFLNPTSFRYLIGAVAALNSQRVVYGSRDGTLRVWDLESEQDPCVLQGDPSPISALAILNSRQVISGSRDGILRVWDLGEKKVVTALKGHSWISAIAVLDYRRVVTGDKTGIIRIWDLERGETLVLLEGLEGHTTWVQAIAVLDDRHLVSGSTDGTLRVWDIESGKAVAVHKAKSDGVNALTVLDGRRILFASSDATLRIWNVDTGETLAVLKGHFRAVKALAMLDSRRAVSGAADRTLRIWDLESENPSSGTGHSRGITAIAVVDHRRAVSGSTDTTLRIWDVEHGQLLGIREAHHRIWAIAVLDDRRVVSGSSDGSLYIWDLKDEKTMTVLTASSAITSADFFGSEVEILAIAAMDNRHVIYGTSDGSLRLWQVKTSEVRTVLEDRQDRIQAVAVVDSQRVIFGSYNGKLQIVDLGSGEATSLFQDDEDSIEALAIMGHRVISGSSQGMLRIHDIETGQLLRSLEGNSAEIRALACLDHRRVVSGALDSTVRVWNLETGETECLFILDAPVFSVAVVPDRQSIIAGDLSGRAYFFDLVEPPTHAH